MCQASLDGKRLAGSERLDQEGGTRRTGTLNHDTSFNILNISHSNPIK